MRVDIEYLVFAMGPDGKKTDAAKVEANASIFTLSEHSRMYEVSSD